MNGPLSINVKFLWSLQPDGENTTKSHYNWRVLFHKGRVDLKEEGKFLKERGYLLKSNCGFFGYLAGFQEGDQMKVYSTGSIFSCFS